MCYRLSKTGQPELGGTGQLERLGDKKPETRAALLAYIQERAATLRRQAHRGRRDWLHRARLPWPTIRGKVTALKATIEGLSLRDDSIMNAATAASQIKALPAFNTAKATAYSNFTTRFCAIPDPNANTDAAEHAVV